MIKNEDGFGTIEVVILLAILVGIALIFKGSIESFVNSLIEGIVNQDFSVPLNETSVFHVFF